MELSSKVVRTVLCAGMGKINNSTQRFAPAIKRN